MAELEQTLDSREVAEMVEKEHSKLLKDIRRYIEQFNEAKIGFVEFFKESTYKDAKGETRPCYRITKKGCEFIAHKMTGQKGTEFTARYINRFHEMQDMLSNQEPNLPWFIRKFQGVYIMLERDFVTITGVTLRKRKGFYREEYFTPGADWNAYGWYTSINREEFLEKHGFDFGDDHSMTFLYPSGVIKALNLLNKQGAKMNQGADKMIRDGIDLLRQSQEKEQREKLANVFRDLRHKQKIESMSGLMINPPKRMQPIQITITLDEEFKNLCKMT